MLLTAVDCRSIVNSPKAVRQQGYSILMQEPQGLPIETLEARVDELIRSIERMSGENKTLRTQRSGLMTERAVLIEKTELARSRVESMITRLKAMES